MKTVILAGGLGTRLAEYTEIIPKPMVEIGERPILWHIMDIYTHYGYRDFIVALGYKSEVIKSYFLNHHAQTSGFTIDLSNGKVDYHHQESLDRRITLVDTGVNSMTGGRVKRLKDYIGNETFMLTYGDGVASVNIDALVKFHKSHGKMATVTAVHPPARFGELEINSDQKVLSFKEKPQTQEGWINGGFFVLEPQFLDLIEDDTTILEKSPLEHAAQESELMAYQHDGFWQCMDTKRDRDTLEALWQSNQAPWNPRIEVK